MNIDGKDPSAARIMALTRALAQAFEEVMQKVADPPRFVWVLVGDPGPEPGSRMACVSSFRALDSRLTPADYLALMQASREHVATFLGDPGDAPN